MKTKLFLLTVIFASFIVACNQIKRAKEKEPELKDVKQEKQVEPITVKGKILNSETGESLGLGMAFITVKGTNTGTISDSEGRFIIQAPAGAKKLVFGANGFESVEVNIAGEKEMEVKLTPKSEDMEQ